MIHVEDAQRIILGRIETLGEETVTLSESAGRILAQSVRARRNLPPWDNSAMDGYGVRACDIVDANPNAPVRLRVQGMQLAGGTSIGNLSAGHAVRIMTGAPIPAGVDVVVMRELCDESEVVDAGGYVGIGKAFSAGEAIRRCGEDVGLNDEIATPGTRVTPGVLNLLASAGHFSVAVTRRPQVAILASGDELKELGEPYTDADILNSNAHAVAAAVAQAGGTPHLLGIAGDSLDAHVEKMRAGAFADVLITIGGVSMGTHDFVRPALEQLGVELDFWKVAMRPGKPLAFGRQGKQAIFGLPGNPVSSLVTFELFVRPALRKMMGNAEPIPQRLSGHLVGAGMKKRGGVAFYARARASFQADGTLRVELEQKQGSGQISGLAWANALCVLAPEVEQVTAGDRVSVLLLDDRALWGPAGREP